MRAGSYAAWLSLPLRLGWIGGRHFAFRRRLLALWLLRRVFAGGLCRSSGCARLGKEIGTERRVGRGIGNLDPCPLVGLTLAPAFDRHREIDAADFLIIAELGLSGLLGSADPPRVVHLDFEIGVRIEPISELVPILLRDLELIGERPVEILAAEILDPAPVMSGCKQRAFDRRPIRELASFVGR